MLRSPQFLIFAAECEPGTGAAVYTLIYYIVRTDDIKDRRFSKDDFVFFWGHTDRQTAGAGKQCLSQWYIAPMTVDGVCYNCMEQYLMAEKARTFGDRETEALIMAEYNQLKIKKLGRKVAGYDDAVWSARRQQVSIRGNICKFAQNPRLKDFLLSTGDKILVEASPEDTVWGIGLDENSPAAIVPSRWRGRNLLGFALMEAREHLRQIQKTLDSIISLKDDDDPWPKKDFVDFCEGHTFTLMLRRDCNKGIYENVKELILGSAAQYADKILIDMHYGPGFCFLPFMFFEQLHEVLDPVAEAHDFSYIFSLTPDPTMVAEKNTVHLTVFA